ncbi:aldo/keto reductase [Trujillonella endophytica]|uniref:Predicted oxidoreductase n=1 Tax=Trujillonella endophytica TaxID=673521 RepID=A0A1H8QRD9_9ACTN|nr:aldo/keto reductase [Trujillella endophytica]SEO56800.1 Predicted oxidoreductase [Trujillella endophytica]
MRTTRLGSTGPTVSIEGLGCMGMSPIYGAADDDESVTTLHRAVELGVTFFDTAEIYGADRHNEKLVGRALAPFRDDVVIATKVGFATAPDRQGDNVGKRVVDGRPESVVAAAEGSLRSLDVDHIDVLYLHRIDTSVPIEDTVGALAELVTAGKIGHIGLSEASPATIRRAHAVHPIAAVQTEYSLFERGIETNGVVETLTDLGIALVPYSPLGRGFLTGQVKIDQLDESDFRHTDPRFQGDNLTANLRIVDAVGQLAARKNVLPSQLALAWTIAQGGVPIPGTKRVKYLEQNAAAADITFTDDELAALDAAAPVGAAVGDRYAGGGMDLLTQ